MIFNEPYHCEKDSFNDIFYFEHFHFSFLAFCPVDIAELKRTMDDPRKDISFAESGR